MKRTTFLLLTLAAVVPAGIWLARVVQRARNDLVTLHTRQAPLTQVVQSVHRQTRERLVADPQLAARVTLDVDNQPLWAVLDQLAEQTGGFARVTYAVYRSSEALERLRQSLQSGVGLAEIGWTNLTSGRPRTGEPHAIPTSDDLSSPPVAFEEGPPTFPGQGPDGPDGGMSGHRVRIVRGLNVDVLRNDGGGPRDGAPSSDGNAQIEGSSHTTMVVTGDQGERRAIDLSPERLVIEQSVADRLGQGLSISASAEGAAEIAARVRGKWVAFYSLERSPIPGLGPEIARVIRQTSRPFPDSRNGAPRMDPASHIEADVRRDKFERLTRLTPEQRAREGSGPRRVEVSASPGP